MRVQGVASQASLTYARVVSRDLCPASYSWWRVTGIGMIAKIVAINRVGETSGIGPIGATGELGKKEE